VNPRASLKILTEKLVRANVNVQPSGKHMFKCMLGIAGIAVAMSMSAMAEVKASAPDGLMFQYKGELPLAREAAWKRVLAVGTWWNDEHTYSGKGANMTVDAVAGGCWCEMWSGGEVEHGRVVTIMNNEMLRFQTALGPLQGLGVNAIMTWTLADGSSPGTTSVTMDYSVVGSSLTNLVPMAAPVDGVLQEQFGRLVAVAS
jgi:uncharacterized protein YndB with AHSA1/START domain